MFAAVAGRQRTSADALRCTTLRPEALREGASPEDQFWAEQTADSARVSQGFTRTGKSTNMNNHNNLGIRWYNNNKASPSDHHR